MTIMHRPSEATLAAFAAGTLDEGQMLVVAAHLASCEESRRIVRMMEEVGGVMLEDLEPAPVAEESLSRVLAVLDEPAEIYVPPSVDASLPELRPEHARLIAPYRMGPWKWIGPGVSWRMIDVPTQANGRVFLLKAAPGTVLPDHTHTGTELTCVLTGAFAHAQGRFGPGDIDEADGDVDHTPVVEAGEDCICLVAMQGRLKLNGLIGRILQPFVRM